MSSKHIRGNMVFKGKLEKTGAGNIAAADLANVTLILVNKTSGAATAVALPAMQYDGQCVIVVDAKGDAATNNITITPASGNINGSATHVISENYGSVMLVWDGTNFTVMAMANPISAAEIAFLNGVTAGTATASKAVVLGAASEISGIRRKVNLAAATQALTAAMSGEKFVGAVDAVFTLPAAAAATKGVWYEFETGALSGGTGLSISPAAADHIRGNGLTSTDDKDLINSGATDRLGDSVCLYCDGVDGWIIESIIGTWAKEA